MSVSKFLRIRSGLHEGARIDYPPIAQWVEREGARKAREERGRLIDDLLAYSILALAVVSVVGTAVMMVVGG